MAKRYSSDPSTRAKELIADGKIGGPREGAGRPRKKSPPTGSRPAAAYITERLPELAPQILRVFKDVLTDPSATDRDKIRAVSSMIGIENRETAREAEERRESPAAYETPGDRAGMETELVRMLSDPLIRKRFSVLLSTGQGKPGLYPLAERPEAARGADIAPA